MVDGVCDFILPTLCPKRLLAFLLWHWAFLCNLSYRKSKKRDWKMTVWMHWKREGGEYLLFFLEIDFQYAHTQSQYYSEIEKIFCLEKCLGIRTPFYMTYDGSSKTSRRPFLSRQDDLLLQDNTSFASRLFMNVFLGTTWINTNGTT